VNPKLEAYSQSAPVSAMKACKKCRGIISLFLNLETRSCEWLASPSNHFTPRKKYLDPSNWRLGEPHSRAGNFKKRNLPSP